MRRLIGQAAVAAALLLASFPEAWAHPHVWVTAKAEILFGPDGKITGIRHDWTFDAAYTAYVTQGLDQDGDGKLTPQELQGLADENAASLSEFGFFTVAKANGKKLVFDTPREPRMELAKDQLAMTFLLPLKAPASASGFFALEIDDPTFFVYFTLGEGTASLKLTGAPSGCVTSVAKAKAIDAATQQILQNEGIFQTPAGANLGLQYSNKAIIACP
jgi:ABC-type uncharacterized transport system substrate-binding protein